jgi:D-alanyl-D-alanine carboxypeptidase
MLQISEAASSETDLPIGLEGVTKLHPVAPDYRPSDLVEISHQYCLNELPHKLRREAAEACIQMLDDARREAGLEIRIVSSYRSFTNQRYIYLRAIRRNGLMQNGVAKPGHSQHQLGTAIDVVGRDLQLLFKEDFGETPEGKWLEQNVGKYGFTIPYQKDDVKRTGYEYEPWHLRYVGEP